MSSVLLREAKDSDIELVLAWRNSPTVYQGLWRQSRKDCPLTWEEHYSWWHSRHNWKRFIIELNDGTTTRSVGYINLGQLDSWKPQIAIVIGEPNLWGMGIGRKALALGLSWLEEDGYIHVWTTILKTNTRSIKLFERNGFKRNGEGREGEWLYELWLKERPHW